MVIVQIIKFVEWVFRDIVYVRFARFALDRQSLQKRESRLDGFRRGETRGARRMKPNLQCPIIYAQTREGPGEKTLFKKAAFSTQLSAKLLHNVKFLPPLPFPSLRLLPSDARKRTHA